MDPHTDLTAELATEVAASLRPALWARDDPIADHARLRWIAQVGEVIDRALVLGSIKAAIWRSRDTRVDLDLVVEILEVKGYDDAARVVEALAARGEDGAALVEAPTGSLPAVPAQARRPPTGSLAVVLPGDELAARRRRR